MRYQSVRPEVRLGLALGIGLAALTLVVLAPTAARSAEAALQQASGGWQTVFTETFESGIGHGWTVTDASRLDGGAYTWGVGSYTSTSPITAAWCVGAGADGSALAPGLDPYPDNADTWLVYGPVVLTDAWDAEVQFNWWLETEADDQGEQGGIQTVPEATSAPQEGDWLGWCVVSDENDLSGSTCTYVSGSIARWARGTMPLGDYVSTGSGVPEPLWIAFHFVSDGDGAAGRGAFVDDVRLRLDRGHEIVLPLVRRDPAPSSSPTPEATNLLENGGFEADWSEEAGTHRVVVFRDGDGAHEENREGIFTPPRWLTWYRYSPGTWEEPGVRVVQEPRRVHGGERGLELATVYRRHDAGLLQQVGVEPGTWVELSAWAHAWSNWHDGPNPDDAGWSEGPGYSCGFALEGQAPDDDWLNFTFQVGIDPTGGVDPYADTVEWGDGAHIYNCYHEVPAVRVKAQSRRVTVFLRSRTAWPFWHNNAYWDDAALVAVDGDGGQSGWTYPVIKNGSKIGVHSILPNRVADFTGDLVDAGAHFPVVKAVDDLAWLTGIKESSPETIIVARVTNNLEGCPKVYDPNTDLDEMANGLLSLILNELTEDARMRGVVEYWEVANEPDPPGPDGYGRLAELMIKCMERAERYGLKLALFSLNAGTPEWDEMQAMVDTGVFARAKEGGHILALHEGTFDTHDPKHLWGQTIPGSPEVEGAGAFNFRYRFLYHLLKQRDEVIPLVVSEWYCGDEQTASTQTLVDALEWYDSEASRDHYFWATLPFTLGPTGRWSHTDYERVYPDLVEYMIEIRDRENGSTSERSRWENLLWRRPW